MSSCFGCKKDFSILSGSGVKKFPCDGCRKDICTICSGISPTEAKCMELKNQRILRFYCKVCQESLLQIPVLIKTVTELQLEISNLKKTMQSAPQVVSTDHTESIINEVAERQRRATNILIFNAPESTSGSGEARRGDDLELFAGVVSDLGITVSGCKAIRLGRPAENRPRPLKVILPSSADAMHILRNKNKLKLRPRMHVVSDQTPLQREFLASLKRVLQERTEGGEKDLIIKYVKGVPTIMKKSVDSTKNHQ